MTWEWILIALPWLFVLACPLMMFWMMRGMSGGSCGKKAGEDQEELTAAAVPVRDQAEEIRQLRERLARLEAEKREAESWS